MMRLSKGPFAPALPQPKTGWCLTLRSADSAVRCSSSTVGGRSVLRNATTVTLTSHRRHCDSGAEACAISSPLRLPLLLPRASTPSLSSSSNEEEEEEEGERGEEA